MAKFTFSDAKAKIKELEEELKKKAGDAILDTSDNVFTGKELKKIKFLEAWAVIGPIVGILIGLIF
ncbi:MAG: hypothetical protein CBC24_08005 [Candidatus Pelagibacter sp. TMED64]|jgi:hypothetical protein|nr:MAG: hypothetical protein CBC24_08005 [Candidatus Pelagibacter sp. TMED64]|tara:strand:- start:701 stop:898 length:198 start_codon:yes stop_codon:yes gene_type:complete